MERSIGRTSCRNRVDRLFRCDHLRAHELGLFIPISPSSSFWKEKGERNRWAPNALKAQETLSAMKITDRVPSFFIAITGFLKPSDCLRPRRAFPSPRRRILRHHADQRVRQIAFFQIGTFLRRKRELGGAGDVLLLRHSKKVFQHTDLHPLLPFFLSKKRPGCKVK